jgi:hypothetical protein
VALVTAAAYKTSRGISGSDFDARIAVAIGVAEQIVRDLCGRDRTAGFESATWTEYLDGTGDDVLRLREWPVASVTSVKYRESSTAFGEALDTSAYYIDPTADNRGELHIWGSSAQWGQTQSVWPAGSKNIQVVYVGGYDTIPADLQEACFILIDSWYASSLRDSVSSQAEVLGQINRTLKTEGEKALTLHGYLKSWKGPLVG